MSRDSPEQTDAHLAAGGETAEPEPLLALDVSQHEGEVLAHLSLGDSTHTRHTRTKDTTEGFTAALTNDLVLKT